MNFWCFAQAKDYGYELNTGKRVEKVKGFKCNAETEMKMTNEQRKQLIKGSINYVDIWCNQFAITNGEVITKQLVKHWVFKFDKKIIRQKSEDEIDTLPYGY